MKKSLLIILSIMIISLIAVSCTNNSTAVKETDNMDKQTESMTEAPKAEMTEAPMAEATEDPMSESDSMTEAPKEDMMIGHLTEDGYIDVTPEEAKKLMESTPNLVVVDVSPLYADGHLPGAINFYVGDGSLDNAIKTLDKSVPYLVYCHSDSASISGSKKLVAAGFEPVYRIIGNYGAWVAAGYPVE